MIIIDQYKSCTKLIQYNKLKFGLWLDKLANQSSNNSNRKHETTTNKRNNKQQRQEI